MFSLAFGLMPVQALNGLPVSIIRHSLGTCGISPLTTLSSSEPLLPFSRKLRQARSAMCPPAYYYEAVKWAQEKGITGGIGNGLFGPNQPCTRAQIVTFLWRAAGSPMVNYAMNMSDVPEGSYYAEAVRWALSEGIATGTTGNTFSPDSECTRAQAVAFLFRYAASEAVTLQELVSGFSDADSVPGYALPAMNWALAEEIVQGNGSKLMPNDSCTRAQIVTFLFRAYQGK